MRFGVFDHLDRSGPDAVRQYEDRLRLVEAYDEAGFHAFHLAEHHSTPLGLAPSPSVFLAAVAQRTTRLRFGPLVYCLSMYHPLRVIEEVCMLDALSGGRMELGVGRGVSPIELGHYGIGEEAQGRYEEALEVILRGLTSERLTFHGEHFSFADVPMELRPVQTPHPPLWFGTTRAQSATRLAQRGANFVCSNPAGSARALTDAYRAAWAGEEADMPLLGMSRHVVVADSDAEALDLLRPAYRQWWDSLEFLWRANGVVLPLPLPRDPDAAVALGLAVAGSPDTVRAALLAQAQESGATYLLTRMAFGSLPVEASLRSVELLAREVMPAFAPATA
jgi:alkanesulfonate monooxygenase SsuD/methylene tetrahydromethanopterin reductase-like flavin-dependent oxidoreductase (luciferase family)